jgi:pilus assembly protein Flp/PilA
VIAADTEQDTPMRRQIQIAIRRFLHSQDGATAIEYALIAAGIAAAIMAAVTTLGVNVNQMWNSVKTALH